MELLGADPDLCPHAELGSIGKAGGGVVIDRCGVDALQKTASGNIVFGDDGFRVAGAVAIDVFHGFFKGVDHLYRQHWP